MNGILKGPAFIHFLVKKIRRKYPNSQIGKTVVQKLMYLIERELNLDFGYSMYHYGPFSNQVAEYLTLAKSIEAIDIEWEPDKGYFIEPRKNKFLENSLGSREKEVVKKIVDKYGSFSAIKLSIITTAIYVRDNFGVDIDSLVDVVASLKPQHKREWIREVLEEAGIIKYS